MPSGTRRSSTSSVIATANTPSLNACTGSSLWPANLLYRELIRIVCGVTRDPAVGSPERRRRVVRPASRSSIGLVRVAEALRGRLLTVKPPRRRGLNGPI